MRFDRRMSFAEGVMWRLEGDPRLSSVFGNVTILDRPVDVARLRARLERASLTVDRLRQRVQEIPGNVAPPVWVGDGEFSMDRHLREVELPAPGDQRALADLAVAVLAEPFARHHPLWEFVVVHGLEGGRDALIQKLHHTVADGETMVAMALQYMDLEREPPPAADPIAAADITRAPSVEQLAIEVVSQVGKAARRGAEQVAALARRPDQLRHAVGLGLSSARDIVGTLRDTASARSPLWVTRSGQRHLEMLRAPFAPAKEAASRFSGTLNHLFLAVAADAAGRYHRERDAPVESLRASMAVSTRTQSSGANAFSLVRFLVPTGEMPLGDRVAGVQAAIADARSGGRGASLDTMARVASALPTPVLGQIARQQARTVDFATSNVRAAPFACYVAGAKVLANHPIGPLAGVAFNLTLLSYDGSLDMGLNVDPAAVADPDLLRRCVEASFDDVVGGRRAPVRSARRRSG